jgi:hypothetical protein
MQELQSVEAKAEEVLPKVGGYLEAVNTDEISGWAWDSRQPDAPVQVEIYEGGTLLTRMVADQFRQDLRDAGAGNGKHGFSFLTPASLKDGRLHLIRVKIAGVEGELDGSPQKLDLLPKVGGSLEAVNSDEIAGWAWDSRQPDAPVQVEIYEGGTLLTRIAADQFRKDLREAGAGNGKHAFSFPTPTHLKDGKPHLIRVKIAGVEGELDGSPQELQAAQ